MHLKKEDESFSVFHLFKSQPYFGAVPGFWWVFKGNMVGFKTKKRGFIPLFQL